MRILIIVPCYNEQGAIVELYHELKAKVPFCDILLVNDCSTDNSLVLLKSHHMNYLSLPINLGIGGAMQAGYMYAKNNKYDIAIQIDGDGQHDPSWVGALIEPLKSGLADMVIGSRFINKEGFQSSFIRRVGIGFFKLIILMITGKRITDATSGFRAVNMNCINLFASNYANDYPEPESVMLVLRNRLRIREVPVVMRERQSGVSSIRLVHSVYYMCKVSINILLSALQPRIVDVARKADVV